MNLYDEFVEFNKIHFYSLHNVTSKKSYANEINITGPINISEYCNNYNKWSVI